MKIIKEIQKCKTLFVDEESIYYYDFGGSCLVRSDFSLDMLWSVEMPAGEMYLSGETIFIDSEEGVYTLYKENGEILGFDEWHILDQRLESNEEFVRLFGFTNEDSPRKDLGYFDQAEDTFDVVLKQVVSISTYCIADVLFINVDEEVIQCVVENELAWEINYKENENDAIEHIYGFFQNLLVLHMKSNQLWLIDLEMGEIQEIVKDVNLKKQTTILNSDAGILHILQGENYIEFDLQKLVYSIPQKIETNNGLNIVAVRYNNLLTEAYFLSKMENENLIGIYSIIEKEIKWSQSLPKGIIFDQAPWVNNDVICFTAKDNTTYFYSRAE